MLVYTKSKKLLLNHFSIKKSKIVNQNSVNRCGILLRIILANLSSMRHEMTTTTTRRISSVWGPIPGSKIYTRFQTVFFVFMLSESLETSACMDDAFLRWKLFGNSLML